MAELAMPDPAPLTSVSNPTGTANGDAISPSTSASDQPGLLVARICPYRGDRGARSSGPNEAIPSAANPGSRYHAVSVATIAGNVSPGTVVGMVRWSSTWVGPWASVQMNLVPPSSPPAK